MMIMKSVVALVFNYALNGLLADPDTDFWRFAFESLDEHGGPDRDRETLDLLEGAAGHLMGRVAYEGMAKAMSTNTEHPWFTALNTVPKIVFSKSLQSAGWRGTTIARGDTAEEIERLREGDGHLIVWGGVILWRSLMTLDVIDEFRISMYPFLTDKGTSLFHDLPTSYRLDLVSSRADPQGVIELHYKRHR
jgi:dihydrofolate reductase